MLHSDRLTNILNRAGRLFAVLAACAILASDLTAQRTLALAVGSRIRVQGQGESSWHVGRLTGASPDTIRVRPCDTCVEDVYSLPSLSAVQVSVGRIRRGSTIFKGAIPGVAIGIAAGQFYGYQKSHGCNDENSSACGIEYLAAPFLGLAGLFMGAAIGSSFRYDDWQTARFR